MAKTYQERLRCYELEKRRIAKAGMTPQQYETELKRLVKKWRV